MSLKLIHISIREILSVLYPQKCLGCGLKNEILCRRCVQKIDYPTLPASGNVFAAADYNDGFAKKTIWLLKYRKIKTAAKPLAELLHTRIVQRPSLAAALKKGSWIIIPVPLSKKRLRERGFNQSELIARNLSDRMSVRMAPDVLYKLKDTPSQVSIKDRKERLANLTDSFAAKNTRLVKDKNVILVDDVTTTGATLKEAHKTLRAAGAKKVIALVVARG
ncbi:MAG: ComF family protein [bacterium]|nr:ComF family protein [bacterium]